MSDSDLMYKVTVYASNKAGNRFRLVWLVNGRDDEACRSYVEGLLNADTENGYFNRDWHVEPVKAGVYALAAVLVPAPHIGVVSGDGENGV